jgi:hypothetical protein
MDLLSFSAMPVSTNISTADVGFSRPGGVFASALQIPSLDVGELPSAPPTGRIASALPSLPAARNNGFVTPLPDMVRGAPLFQANPAQGADLRTFLGENETPARSVVLNTDPEAYVDIENGNGLSARMIAQAALKVDPEMSFVVPARTAFTSTKDEAYLSQRDQIAGELGVPSENVAVVSAGIPMWPMDMGRAGYGGFVVPNRFNLTRLETGPQLDGAQVPLFAGRRMAGDLGIPVSQSSVAGRGGDTQYIRLEDGTLKGIFGKEAIEAAAVSNGIELDGSDAGRLRAIGLVMAGMAEDGVPLDQSMALGVPPRDAPDMTYGAVLAGLTLAERESIPSDVMQRFEALADVPFPSVGIDYHIDLTLFSPDGQTAFVSDRQMATLPSMRATLEANGYNIVELPGGLLTSNSDFEAAMGHLQDEDKPYLGTSDYVASGQRAAVDPLELNYLNMVTGVDREGRQFILMPTEAYDPESLTPRDLQVRDALQAASPEARIIPVGGSSAIMGVGELKTSADASGEVYFVIRNSGIHCMSLFLPFEIAPRMEAP